MQEKELHIYNKIKGTNINLLQQRNFYREANTQKKKRFKRKEKKTVLKTKRRTIWQAWGSTKLKLYA